MSRRIAHRPRYRNGRQNVPTPLSTRQNLFYGGWSYRRQQLSYEKHALGYGLSLIPLNSLKFSKLDALIATLCTFLNEHN